MYLPGDRLRVADAAAPVRRCLNPLLLLFLNSLSRITPLLTLVLLTGFILLSRCGHLLLARTSGPTLVALLAWFVAVYAFTSLQVV